MLKSGGHHPGFRGFVPTARLCLERVGLEDFEIYVFEDRDVGGFEDDGGRQTGVVGFDPAAEAEAPVVAGSESGELPLRARSAEVVAAAAGEFEKFVGHDRAECVLPLILGMIDAVAVTGEAGHGVPAAGNERTAEDVGGHERNLRWNNENTKHETLQIVDCRLPIYCGGVEDPARIDQEYVWHPFTQMKEWSDPANPPLVIVEAEGSELVDADGKRYLDGNASIWTNIHGHRDPDLDVALQEQLGRLAHCSALGLANEPAARLAQELVESLGQGGELGVAGQWAGGHKVFYSDDGSTAIEAGLKMIHQARVQRGEAGRTTLLSLASAYHGDTIGAMSIGHSPVFHCTYKELLFESQEVMRPVCYRCPYNRAPPEKGEEARKTRSCQWECLGKLEEKCHQAGESLSALVIEPRVQGPGGMAMMPEGYLKQAADVCRSQGAWLMLDEVMTGFGRTGTLFACQKEEVVPDLMALGKGMTGGYLPMAATLAADEIYQAFIGDYEEQKTFYHGHSYTGNPLGAAVARASLKKLREGGLARAEALADQLAHQSRRLWELDNVGEVRQEGTILAVELVEDFLTARAYDPTLRMGNRVCMKAREFGLLTRPIGDVIVLMLPLSTTGAQVELAIGALDRAIRVSD